MFLALAAALVVLTWRYPVGIQRMQRQEAIDEASFLRSIAGETRRGASLRAALAAASGESDHTVMHRIHRRVVSGAPLGEVATALADLPRHGRKAAVALRVAAATGGSPADVFDRLAEQAVDAAALAREQRTLTAQTRASAAVVAALPVASLLLGGGSRIGDLASSGSGGLTVALAGAAMQIAGIAAVWAMAKT